MARVNNLIMENATITFRNFDGEHDNNARGKKVSFGVLVDNADVERLLEDGWNIKTKVPENPNDEPYSYLPVEIRFDHIPPKVFMVTRRAKTQLHEDTVGLLQSADIQNADLIISPYEWEVGDKHGIKAYLKTGYITVEEDEFAAKYDRAEKEPLPFA